MWRLALALLVAIMALAPAAWAQMSPEEQFVEGQRLYDSGKPEEALPFFKNAYERTKSPNARIYIARILEKQGRLTDAYTEMKGTVTLAALQPDKYSDTKSAAEKELIDLRARVGLVTITLEKDYADAEVTLNGEKVQLGEPIAVKPGTVEVKATAPGFEDGEKSVEVAAGGEESISLELVEIKVVGDDDDDHDGGGFVMTPVRIAGFAVAGLGVVGLVVFAITGSLAKDKFEQVETECMGTRCTDPKFENVIDKGKRLSLVANVTAGVGGALLVAGALMVIFGGPLGNDDGNEARLHVVASPGGVGLGGSF